MANEFIIKNGFYSQGNSAVTGSLIISASSDTNDLQVGVNKLFVSASGNVGIGTTSPSTKLHIIGDAMVDTAGTTTLRLNNTLVTSADSTGVTGIYLGDASSGVNMIQREKVTTNTAGINLYAEYGYNTPSLVAKFQYNLAKFYTGGTQRFYLDGNGNVAIGNNISPSAKLHVNNTTTDNSFLIEDDTNPDASPFVIDNTGSVGIGTITPRSKMDISGSIYIASNMTSYSTRPTVGTASLQYGGIHSYSLSEGAKSDAGFLRISAGGEITASNKTFIDLSGYSNVNDMNQNIVFGTRDQERMRIDQDGDVGIGISTPTARLHVTHTDAYDAFKVEDSTNPDSTPFVIDANGNVGIGNPSPSATSAKLTVQSSDTEGTIRLGGGNGVGNARLFLQSNATNAYIDMYGNNQYLPLRIDAGPLSLNSVAGSGNVGIGTDSPNAKLDVNGNTIITGSLTVTDGITASLQGTSSYSTLSLDTVNKATYTVGIMSGSENWSTSNNGTITLPTVDVLLYDNANFSGSAKLYTVLGGTTGTGGIPALTDHDTNYITIEYNGGSPIYNVSTADTSNDSNINLVYITYRLGNFVHILDFGNQGAGLANKINRRIEKTNRFGRESGLNLNLSGSTGIAIIASGVAWNGSNRQTLAEVNSNDDIFFKNYRASSTWSYTTAQNYINNTYYDNGTDLVPITSGSYVVNWYYRGQELNDHIYEVVSQDEYANVAEARLATAPTLPELVESHAFLAGRIIIQSGSYDGIVESAYTSVFQATTVTSHNDLVGLQGGSGNQYYHLNSNEYTNIVLKNVNNHFTAGQTISGSLNISGSLQVGGIILGDGGIQLSGSSNINGDTAITGSLTVTGNLGGTGGNIDMNAMIQASLLYLSNNF